MAFNLDDYEPVADRIERFWKDHPEGKILTDLVFHDGQSFIVKASIWRKNPTIVLTEAAGRGEGIERIISSPDTSGFAEEIIGSTNVNRTSALENCETSAIGRALANLGYAVKNRASREEMVKVQPSRRKTTSNPAATTVTPKPESTERPVNGLVTHLTPEQAIEIAGIKRSLLARLDGDKEEASRLWEGTIRNFGLDPKQPLPADMIPAVEHAIKSLGIKGEE